MSNPTKNEKWVKMNRIFKFRTLEPLTIVVRLYNLFKLFGK
jgi:hypothetical protein